MLSSRLIKFGAIIGLMMVLAACESSTAPSASTTAPIATTHPIVKPTASPIASPTLAPTASPVGTLTPTPDARITTTFAADVDPLTGEKVTDPAVLNRRPLAIKIGDSIEVGVRPQAGADFADWVIEHESEGGIPRWTAVFYSQTPARVGGTRSCRIIDTEIPAIFSSLLACSGMSGGTREFYIKPSDFNQEHRFFTPDFGDYTPMFYRGDNAPVPHNLFAVPAEIWKEADKRGSDAKPTITGLAFATEPIETGRAATDVKLKYGSETINWKFDLKSTTCGSLSGCYLRWGAGVPQTDALNSQQLSVANVIVIYANHVEDGRFLEEDYGAFKAFGIQIQLWNSGSFKLFRDGREFDGTWSRTERNQMLKFMDAASNLMPLKPGKTWLELQRLDAPIDVK